MFETDYQKGISTGIRFSANSRRLIFGNSDTRARTWDLDTRAAAGPLLRHSTYVREAVLNPDGTRAATYAGDRLFIWDVESGKVLTEYPVPRAHLVQP